MNMTKTLFATIRSALVANVVVKALYPVDSQAKHRIQRRPTNMLWREMKLYNRSVIS